MPRVLSLLPAATEIVAALGGAAWLVGVTHECDEPASVARLPRVTSSAVDARLTAGAVDAAVRALHEAGAPLFALDRDAIAALGATVILTQRLCDVCAVDERDVRALASRIEPSPAVVTLGATTLDGVLDDLVAVAGALGVPDVGAALVASARDRMRRVHERLKAARAPRPRTAVVEWTDPIFAAGHWVPDMVRRAGGIDVLAVSGEHSRPRTMAELVAADPELLLIAPCGYDIGRAEVEGRRLLADRAWAWASDRRVWAVDGNALVSRPGPRLVDGVETFAAIMAPTLFEMPSGDMARRLA